MLRISENEKICGHNMKWRLSFPSPPKTFKITKTIKIIYLGARSLIRGGAAVLDTRLGDLVRADLGGLCLDRFLTG